MKRKEGKALQSVFPRTFREITTDACSRRFDSSPRVRPRADRYRLHQFLETGFLDLDPVEAWRKVRLGVFAVCVGCRFVTDVRRITGIVFYERCGTHVVIPSTT